MTSSNHLHSILPAAKEYAISFLKTNIPEHYGYHNLAHTEHTVKSALEIGQAEGLSAEDMEILELAAWFHDLGYAETYRGHEERSTELARAFLKKHDYPSEKIDLVSGCIMATKVPHQPQNTLEEIICDADTSGLGSHSFFDNNQNLREEWEALKNQKFSELEWAKMGVDFLSNHQYFTAYSNSKYAPVKQQNIKKLEKQLTNLQTDPNAVSSDPASAKHHKKKKDKEKKKDKNKDKDKDKVKDHRRPERGIETMFRVSLRNHINLSAIADNKANIMLSINAIIISIILSTLVPLFSKADPDQEVKALMFATGVLMLVCILSMIFATLSTMPKVTNGKFTKESIINREANLLFFGNFHNMSLQEYEWGMNEMMSDRDFLYGSLTRDFYNLGKVLSQKYRYLRFCYLTFMFGIVTSVLAYVVALMVPGGM